MDSKMDLNQHFERARSEHIMSNYIKPEANNGTFNKKIGLKELKKNKTFLSISPVSKSDLCDSAMLSKPRLLTVTADSEFVYSSTDPKNSTPLTKEAQTLSATMQNLKKNMQPISVDSTTKKLPTSQDIPKANAQKSVQQQPINTMRSSWAKKTATELAQKKKILPAPTKIGLSKTNYSKSAISKPTSTIQSALKDKFITKTLTKSLAGMERKVSEDKSSVTKKPQDSFRKVAEINHNVSKVKSLKITAQANQIKKISYKKLSSPKVTISASQKYDVVDKKLERLIQTAEFKKILPNVVDLYKTQLQDMLLQAAAPVESIKNVQAPAANIAQIKEHNMNSSFSQTEPVKIITDIDKNTEETDQSMSVDVAIEEEHNLRALILDNTIQKLTLASNLLCTTAWFILAISSITFAISTVFFKEPEKPEPIDEGMLAKLWQYFAKKL